MAVDADAEKMSFDQSVRIFVDTNVDTHFIVSIVRTSTVAELRELVKVTHRHCYPGKGDVEIGQLAVPGGEYGYHLAEFLRIGQVYDKDEGKVLAEVNSCDPASSSRDGLERRPALSFTKRSTRKIVPLLAPQPLAGEPCAQLAVEPWKELKEPKLLKEEADGDVGCLLGSQDPLDRNPGIVSGLANSLEEPTDGRLLESLGAVPCDGGARNAEAPLVTKVSSLGQGLFLAEPDRVSEGVTPVLTFDIKGVSRKRDSSVSNERPKKSRKLTKAPSDSTSNVPEANGRLKVRSEALDWKGGDRLNPDGMHEDLYGLTGGSLSQVNRSGDLDSNLLSGRKRKKKKKQHVLNPGLTTGENRNEAFEDEPPEVKDKEERCDPKTENKEDASPAISFGVVASGNVGLEVDRGKKSDSLPDGPGESPVQLPKKKKKKRREQNQEQEPERKLTKTRKNKKYETVPVVSASLNHVLNESNGKQEQENGQCTDVTSALVDRGHQLVAKATSPNHSQHLITNEEVDNIAPKVVDKIKTRKKLRKRGTSLSVDVSDQKGPLNSERPSLLNLSKDEALGNGIPGGESQVPNETSGEGMIRNNAELATIDDKVLSPRKNLNSVFNDAETSTSHKGGSGASPTTQAGKVGCVESLESPNSSKKAGRGAPSETRHSESSQGVTNGERRNTKGSEMQRSQGSEETQQHSEGVNEGPEVSAAPIRRARVKRLPSYSEANSGRVIASPGRVAHVSSDRLESEPGRVDQFKVAKPDKVALSGTCTGESSAKSHHPRSAKTDKVGNQHDPSRKEDRIGEALRMSPTPNSERSPEEHASTSPKRVDGRETNLKIDSLQFFSQDQSFQVAPEQVAKALSDNTTEDNSDESDTNPVEDIDEFKKQEVDNLGISDKGVGELDNSSDETGRGDDPPLTTRISVPLDSGSGGMKTSQIFKRRASGKAADIKAKFAHFIESQDGLDELMGITLGQRKRSMPFEPLTQAGSVAIAADSLFDLPSNTQESVKNCSMTLPGLAAGLERYQAIDLAPASQISTEKLLTPQFKVPKPVTIEKIAGARLGASTALQSPGKEVPKTGVKALRLKRTDSIKQADKKKERKSLPEKHNDASPLAIRESSEKTSMDDQEAAEEKQTPAGLYNLLYTPESLKETFRNDPSAATNRKSSVEKTSKERKRLEVQDAQFMIAINTDHISEDKREEKLESNQETKGPSSVIEDAPNTTVKKRKERKRRVSLETGLVGSQDASDFAASGKKKKRTTLETGEKGKKKRRLDVEEATILREASVDRSARETEELYLKFEKSNKKIRLQSRALRLKEDAGKIENRVSPAANSDPVNAVVGEDVAQSKLQGGEALIDDSDNNEEKVISDTPVPGGIVADSKPSPDLCGGTSEASDREDGVFLSEDEKVAAAHQDKPQKDVFDFVSEDEAPRNTVSKTAKKSGMKESKAQRLEGVASRAVQRVLEDEMLHVMDSTASVGKNSRKVAVPVKWTVRMRGSPIALATSLHGGTVPSDAIYPSRDVDGGTQVERGVENTTEVPKALKVRKIPKAKPKQPSGTELCPVGCGRAYSAKTSAYYTHKRTCTGAPTEKFYKRQPRKRMIA